MDDWRNAFGALYGEIRRFEQYGITDQELDDAKKRVIATAEAEVVSAPTSPSEGIAASILTNIIEGDTFDTHEEELRVYKLGLADCPWRYVPLSVVLTLLQRATSR